jgi:hypothetical protein
MRAFLTSTAVALLIGLSPASAAMCGGGGGQQAASSGGMCGAGGGAKQMSEWPARDAEDQKPAEGQKQAAKGMCGCCKDMAMMGGTKGDDPHKGMDMPKQ